MAAAANGNPGGLSISVADVLAEAHLKVYENLPETSCRSSVQCRSLTVETRIGIECFGVAGVLGADANAGAGERVRVSSVARNPLVQNVGKEKTIGTDQRRVATNSNDIFCPPTSRLRGGSAEGPLKSKQVQPEIPRVTEEVELSGPKWWGQGVLGQLKSSSSLAGKSGAWPDSAASIDPKYATTWSSAKRWVLY